MVLGSNGNSRPDATRAFPAVLYWVVKDSPSRIQVFDVRLSKL